MSSAIIIFLALIVWMMTGLCQRLIRIERKIDMAERREYWRRRKTT
jgi:hypothetical protein